MKSRTVSVFIVALVLASGAAWLANRWIQLQVNPASAKGDPTSSIVVASQTIPMGQKIVDAQIELSAWPANRVPDGAFKDLKEVGGEVALQTIYRGEPILHEKVAKHAGGSMLSALIAKNMRAVTVRVNDVVGVAGFVLPGNTVDVLATEKEAHGGKLVARTVLQNVKVLAVDQTTGGKDKPKVVRAVTLELSPENAERLVEARSLGNIQLALRNSLDTKVVSDAPVPPPQAKPLPKKQRREEVSYITIIRGTEVSEVRKP